MKKVFLVLIGVICSLNALFVFAEERTTELGDGNIRFEVTYTEPKDYVEVFIKKNEIQILAQEITDSFSANGDGTFSYELILDGFEAGDLVTSRFYSHSDGAQEFNPQSSSPELVHWGQSVVYTNPVHGSPYITELPNGKILFKLKVDQRQEYVEIFIRKNGLQIIAEEITANYNATQGIYYYLATGYASGDDIDVRFYSHKNGVRKFAPGRLEQEWFEHTVGAHPNPSFLTEDASYTVGTHSGSNGLPTHTEVFFDIGFDYLTPFSGGSGLATSWIVDRALAQSFNRDYLLNTVEFGGMYIRHCVSGEWVNINETDYAPVQSPLFLGSWNFSLNHYYSNTLLDVLLDPEFSCPNVPAKMTTVSIGGAPQSVLAKGRVHFAYVIHHK